MYLFLLFSIAVRSIGGSYILGVEVTSPLFKSGKQIERNEILHNISLIEYAQDINTLCSKDTFLPPPQTPCKNGSFQYALLVHELPTACSFATLIDVAHTDSLFVAVVKTTEHTFAGQDAAVNWIIGEPSGKLPAFEIRSSDLFETCVIDLQATANPFHSAPISTWYHVIAVVSGTGALAVMILCFKRLNEIRISTKATPVPAVSFYAIQVMSSISALSISFVTLVGGFGAMSLRTTNLLFYFIFMAAYNSPLIIGYAFYDAVNEAEGGQTRMVYCVWGFMLVVNLIDIAVTVASSVAFFSTSVILAVRTFIIVCVIFPVAVFFLVYKRKAIGILAAMKDAGGTKYKKKVEHMSTYMYVNGGLIIVWLTVGMVGVTFVNDILVLLPLNVLANSLYYLTNISLVLSLPSRKGK